MKKRKKIYIKELTRWVQNREKDLDYAYEQFDKLIITLASGGLVLTIGFVKDIVHIIPSTDTTLLKYSWYLFTSSLIIALLGHIFAILANRIIISIKIEEIDAHKEKVEFNNNSIRIRLKRWIFKSINLSLKSTNIIAFISLLTAIIVFVTFVNQNI